MDLDSCIQRVQQGEVDAFEPVIRRHAPAIRAWAIVRCPPGADADEVVQRTFVKAFQKIGHYRLGTNMRAWLFSIARFELLAECTRLRRVADYRSRYAASVLNQELRRRIQDEPADEPRLAHLNECLSQMSEAPREILRWRYADGLLLEQIAGRTGRSVGAIKKHLFKLRQRLKCCVEKKLAMERSS